ncbi:MAG TPA: pyruvate kinase, partial [bacterium]|nr:pyruvate kinase [bacterium]
YESSVCVKISTMPQIPKLTKIIATVGPASETPETLEKLAKAGVNLFRLNTKHNTLDWHLSIITAIKRTVPQAGIIVDLQGPEIRLESSPSNAPTLTSMDMEILKALPKDVDFIALSYVRNKMDIITLQNELKRLKLNSKIIAKIENQEGLDNIDQIVTEADAIMIARGDLGKETPAEKIPYLQKIIINKCRNAAKPVIVATEMLLSMTKSATPTRAEIADVANAVYDRADAVMLSEETAVGKFPVDAVETMVRTVAFNEKQESLGVDFVPDSLDQTHAVVRSALTMLEPFSGVNVSKLVVGTQTGYTAQVFSSYRPKVPILALSDKKSTVGILNLSYGVFPIFVDFSAQDFSDLDVLTAHLKDLGLVSMDEMVLFVHGKRTNDPGKTNSLAVLRVD